MRDRFSHFAARTGEIMGSYWAFLLAILTVVVWGITGPLFQFSDTWQLVINTGTTIVTFLMVFLLQNSQNREAQATQLKLDELIRAVDQANNQLIDAEDCTEDELEQLRQSYQAYRTAQDRIRGKRSQQPILVDNGATRPKGS
jgi:low affinity Fe/Cu permease